MYFLCTSVSTRHYHFIFRYIEREGYMPKISLVVPVYNASEYLIKCLQSIKNQSFDDYEVILVDDGSTDNSLEIMLSFSDNDSRFKSYRKNNGGVSSARNFGLSKAKGEWIAFVDADDWIEPVFCETMLNIALNHQLDVLQCRRIDEKNDGTYLQVVTQKEYLKVLSFDAFMPTEEDFYGTCWGFLFRKVAIGTTRFDETISFTEDALFSLQVMKNTAKIGIINEYLYHYNLKEHSSLSQGKFDEKKMTILKSRAMQVALFENEKARRIMLGRLADGCYALLLYGLHDKSFMKYYYPDVKRVFKKNFRYWNEWRGGHKIKRIMRVAYYFDLRLGFYFNRFIHKSFQ